MRSSLVSHTWPQSHRCSCTQASIQVQEHKASSSQQAAGKRAARRQETRHMSTEVEPARKQQASKLIRSEPCLAAFMGRQQQAGKQPGTQPRNAQAHKHKASSTAGRSKCTRSAPPSCNARGPSASQIQGALRRRQGPRRAPQSPQSHPLHRTDCSPPGTAQTWRLLCTVFTQCRQRMGVCKCMRVSRQVWCPFKYGRLALVGCNAGFRVHMDSRTLSSFWHMTHTVLGICSADSAPSSQKIDIRQILLGPKSN